MMMNLASVPALDLAMLGLLVVAWVVSGWVSEQPPKSRPSVSWLMEEYRRDWMRTFVTRQPRIFDATLIDSLRQGTAFFASACMIAIGGGVAVIGNAAARLGSHRLTGSSDGLGRCGLDQIVGIKTGIPDVKGAGMDVLPQMLPIGTDAAPSRLAAIGFGMVVVAARQHEAAG